LFTSREYTNYTYDLTDLNKRHLGAFVSTISLISPDRALEFIAELDHDEDLKSHVREAISNTGDGCFADRDIRFGRRLGWYAITRALKPRCVVETGVDKGLGACALTAALCRNEQEGFPGFYYGTDVNLRAGYLLKGRFAQRAKILYGDSIESLRVLDQEIDLFINDSDHSPTYEREEYQAIEDKLSRRAIVLSDNAHHTDELMRFARRTRRAFLFFQERPHQHWYPGAGIGAAFPHPGFSDTKASDTMDSAQNVLHRPSGVRILNRSIFYHSPHANLARRQLGCLRPTGQES